MKKYTKDHEWIDVQADKATVGVSQYAQEQLGDIVFVELPKIGKEVKQGEEIAVVESVKAASEVYAPASGTVIAVNEALVDCPEMVNQAPEGEGWFFKLHLKNAAELEALMDEASYRSFI